MNKKQLLEFIPLILFLISALCLVFQVPYARLTMVISGFLLSSLYFYLAFWLYSNYPISVVNRIIAGLSFSTTIIALIFCFLSWSFWLVYCIFSFMLLGVVAGISLFNTKNIAYKQLLYRSIFLPLFLYSALVINVF